MKSPLQNYLVDIVVVNWNSGVFLHRCLESIYSSAKKELFNIIVVDNASTDGSDAAVRNFKGVRFVRSVSNLGFAKACNIGSAYGSSRYILFLNPDASVHEFTISDSIAFLEKLENKNIGICGVQLLNNYGLVTRSCAQFPTPYRFFLQSIGVDRVFRRYSHFMVMWPHDRTMIVDQVIGAYFLVRREVFHALRGFDTRFYVYFEEVDFSLRAKNAGWASAYYADVQAFHAGGGSSHKIRGRRLFYSIRSRLLYSFKHFSLASAISVTVVTFVIEPVVRMSMSLIKGLPMSVVHTSHAYLLLCYWVILRIFGRST